MLIELKRCNSIGSIDGLYFLVSMLCRADRISRKEVMNRCSLESNININCSGAIAFLNYLGYLKTDDFTLIGTEKLNYLNGKNKSDIVSYFVKECILKLTQEGLFDQDNFIFNIYTGRLDLKKSTFPLAYAAIRNFMINAGAFDVNINGELCVSELYEKDFMMQVRSHKKKISLEQLMKKQEQQSKQGFEAEEFVLNFEQIRLPRKAKLIKRISDFDVTAGYDIVSYSNENIEKYNRFIEVKSYIGETHFFWSENEVDVARIKGDQYILCLVDYERINEEGYIPEFIINPFKTIFNEERWLINYASYRIQKV
jgi:hypothetical protein